MDNHSFNMQIMPLNIEYRKIFGEIPRITDYSCSREDYVTALERAIKDDLPLSDILMLRKRQYQDEGAPER